MKEKTYKDHILAYDLYLKIMDVLVGQDVDIARLALFKCQWALSED